MSISISDFEYEEINLNSYKKKDSCGNLENINIEEYNVINKDDSNLVKRAKELVQEEKLKKELYMNYIDKTKKDYTN